MIPQDPSSVKVVVSLTSTSRRLAFLPEVLRHLLAQSRKPDRVMLWLSRERFLFDRGVSREDLSSAVREMEERGEVEIRFTENVGPHRKLLPALRLFKDDEDPPLIVTADDDVLYPKLWLESLVGGFAAHRSAVCFRARRIRFDGENFEPYRDWPKTRAHEDCLSYRLLVTGRDGCLVHRQILDPRILDPDFLELSRTRSDVWIAGALMSAGTPVLSLANSRLFLEDGVPVGNLLPAVPAAVLRQDSDSDLFLYNEDYTDGYIRRTMAFFASDCPTVREFVANEESYPSRPPFQAHAGRGRGRSG